jgi:site-specific DNA-methyltransferase (adenine-specific)|tara:strand:- start:1596 stop:2684 length:1089 start_codon:yes stop_codon:yes gene_type:complete
MKIDIYTGDCLDSLKQLEDQSINTCITSPPYFALRDYGVEGQLGLEETPKEFIDNLVNVFKEVKRVLRDDGTVWLNIGDSYGNEKHLLGIPWRVAFAMQDDGWILRQDIIWNKPNPMPESVKDRCTKAHEYIFLFSKSKKYYFDNEAIKEESVTVNSKGERGKPNSAKNIGKSVESVDGFDIRGGFKDMGAYEKKNKRSVWTVNTKPFTEAHFATFPKELILPCVLAGCPEKICVECGKPYERVMQRPKQLEVERNKRSGLDDRKVGGVLDKYNRENPPIDLGVQKQCDCKTNETKAGTVLDPFAGSGTTGIVADHRNRNAVLLELSEDYIKIAVKRIKKEVGTLFLNLNIIRKKDESIKSI